VIAAIEATGGLDYTLSLAREQCAQAQAALKGLPESNYKTGLAELARFAVEHTT
jgi:geranylgeranyl pyrophosphate synthase